MAAGERRVRLWRPLGGEPVGPTQAGDPQLHVPPTWRPVSWSGSSRVIAVVRDSYRRLMVSKENVGTIASQRDAPVLPGTIVGHPMNAPASGLQLDLDLTNMEIQAFKSKRTLSNYPMDSRTYVAAIPYSRKFCAHTVRAMEVRA